VRLPKVLGDEELRTLAGQVMAPDVTEPFGAYLFHVDHRGAELARSLETEVLGESFGDSPEDLLLEYGAYEQSSFFFCVIDHRRRLPAGMMRVIVPSPIGFKSLNDIERVWGESAESVIDRTGLGIDLTRTWDVATLAVAAEYRGKAARGLVSMALYQSLIMAAFHCGVVWLVAVFDMPVLRLVRWKLRLTWTGFDGLAPARYLGSVASIPAWCNLLEAERKVAKEDPELYSILRLGEGLEPALRKVDLLEADDFRVWGTAQAAG
jgi:hypothetical protein